MQREQRCEGPGDWRADPRGGTVPSASVSSPVTWDDDGLLRGEDEVGRAAVQQGSSESGLCSRTRPRFKPQVCWLLPVTVAGCVAPWASVSSLRVFDKSMAVVVRRLRSRRKGTCSESHRDRRGKESPGPRPTRFSVCGAMASRGSATQAGRAVCVRAWAQGGCAQHGRVLENVCVSMYTCESVSGISVAPWGQGLHCLWSTLPMALGAQQVLGVAE